jgi:hypothetical protein
METEETLEGTMGRPERHDVDYFPFFAKRGKTLNILQSKYGLEGIGFFTNLMRFLALTPDHHYCIKEETDRMNFFAEIGIQDENRGLEMIELMVKTEKLDRELWEKYQVIVSQAFLDSLGEAYKQRKNEIITIDVIRSKFENHKGNGQNHKGNGLNHTGNPQSKVKKSKVKESKEDSEAAPPAFPENPLPSKPEKTKKVPLREREPVNDMECVEKAYLLNWDTLYSQGKVKTPEPVINWRQTRAQLKKHFEELKPEQIVKAVNDGLKDNWVMDKGYSLGIILSAAVLNRLINAYHLEEKQFGKPSEGTVDTEALCRQFNITGTEAEKRRKLIELRDQGRVSF